MIVLAVLTVLLRTHGRPARTPSEEVAGAWRRVAVRGPSMSPALHDGDVVLVRFGARGAAGRRGARAVGDRPGQLSVKRAVRAAAAAGGCAATTRSAPPTPTCSGPPRSWPWCGRGSGPARAASRRALSRRACRSAATPLSCTDTRRRGRPCAGARVASRAVPDSPTSGPAATSCGRARRGRPAPRSGPHPRAPGARRAGARRRAHHTHPRKPTQ